MAAGAQDRRAASTGGRGGAPSTSTGFSRRIVVGVRRFDLDVFGKGDGTLDK